MRGRRGERGGEDYFFSSSYLLSPLILFFVVIGVVYGSFTPFKFMSNQYLGIIIGGLLPAALYSITGIFSKVSNQAGIGVGPYLIIIGLAIALTGGGFLLFQPDMTVNWRSGAAALGIGLTWGIGSGLIAIALVKYRAPLSQIVPLYNLNTLIVVLLSLWIFSEWKDVSALKLVVGSALIVAGGTLVSVA